LPLPPTERKYSNEFLCIFNDAKRFGKRRAYLEENVIVWQPLRFDFVKLVHYLGNLKDKRVARVVELRVGLDDWDFVPGIELRVDCDQSFGFRIVFG
jgi:hypothetical protein